MKFKALVVAVFALLVASSAFAANTSTVGVNVGTSIPLGDLSDAAGIGFHVGGEYCYMMNEQFGVGGDLAYHKLGSKDVTTILGSVSSEFSMIQYGAHGKYMFPATGDVKPYLKVGIGLYSSTAKAEASGGGSAESSDTNFGLNFGGGADWKINDKMGWGLNGAYHYISSEGDAATMITLSAGLRWGIGN